jgi:hypothetical protein
LFGVCRNIIPRFSKTNQTKRRAPSARLVDKAGLWVEG